MLVLITYDVNTEDAAGRKRLRQIAKQCVNYGQRVQNSVFECLLDTAQCRALQAKLVAIMDPERDSLRFYYLGKKYESKIEHFGCKQTYQSSGQRPAAKARRPGTAPAPSAPSAANPPPAGRADRGSRRAGTAAG